MDKNKLLENIMNVIKHHVDQFNFNSVEKAIEGVIDTEIKNTHKERFRIWSELIKGEKDGAFSSTLELEVDDVYKMIFNDEPINNL